MSSITSVEKVQELRNAIQQNLDNLPDANTFSESNAHDKRLMLVWLTDLDRLLEGQATRTDAVSNWFAGDDDHFLNDFLS